MRKIFGGTVLATVLIGALALPTNLVSPQEQASQPSAEVKEGNKDTKAIFGIDFDLNLMKNTTLIPNPSFINLSTGFGDGWDLGGGIVFPSYFPLSLFIPPFNLTYDINKYQQANLDINAGAGDLSLTTTTPSPGWTTSTTTQGWTPPPTQGWTPPPPTTAGWTPPPTTAGWTPPPTTTTTTTTTTTPPPTTTTAGWTSTHPTPGWVPSVGWSWSKSPPEAFEIKAAPGNLLSKPILTGDRDKPKPAPPTLQIIENSQSAEKDPGGETQNFVSNSAHSVLSSELPAPEPATVEAPEVEEKEHYYNPIYHTMMHTAGSGTFLKPLASMAVFQDRIPGDEDKKKSTGKARRHAEEDPESFADPDEASESEEHVDVRKSENSLEKAVATAHGHGHGHGPSNAPKGNTNYNPGKNKPRPYGMDKPSKARPILGQDKPNRPQYSSSGNGGLIHSQKEEIPILDDTVNSDATSVFGFQIPSINWSAFTDIFESFMGSRTTTKTGPMAKMAKSDSAEGEKCIEDELDSSSEVRSPEELGVGYLCGAGKESDNREVKRNLCSKACARNGFAGGSCVIRQDLMPGCLCRLPNSREYGMMLELYRQEPKDEVQAMEQSVVKSNFRGPCKRCGCMDACKRDGSFTGFCSEKCYCANPWYTHKI